MMPRSGVRELLGSKRDNGFRDEEFGIRNVGGVPAMPISASTAPIPNVPGIAVEIEKAVRKMPTIYVIAFFGVVVACAVFIIWNTLQVNRLTSERTKLDDEIAQTEQKLIRLRAEEMQLSARSRVSQIAHAKFGMVEAMSEDIVVVK